MRFSVVGAIGTSAHFITLYSLVEYQGIDPVLASVCGALAGLVINYTLSYSMTFKSRQPHVQTFPKFALIATLSLCFNSVIMSHLTPHIYYLFAQVITSVVVLIWNYLANSFWTFQMDMSVKKISR